MKRILVTVLAGTLAVGVGVAPAEASPHPPKIRCVQVYAPPLSYWHCVAWTGKGHVKHHQHYGRMTGL